MTVIDFLPKCILIYYLNKPVPYKTIFPLKLVTYVTIARFWKQLQKDNSENALYHTSVIPSTMWRCPLT